MRRPGTVYDSKERLRSRLRSYDLDLVNLEIGRRGSALVWIATALDGNRAIVRAVAVAGDDPHAKSEIRAVMRAVVEARAA